MTIVQDMEIVLGYSGYDFINETKMGKKGIKMRSNHGF